MYIGYFLITIGVIFLFLGALGIFRMPDIYNRLQAGTKASTLGALSLILGVGIVQPAWFFKTLVIAIFIVMTNPISSHSIGRAAYKSGVKPIISSGFEEYGSFNFQNEGSDKHDISL